MTAPVAGSSRPDLRRMTANSVVGSVGTMASRFSGLLRIVVVAAVLGPTQFGDLYQATNNLPNLMFELLTGALFVSLIVPALVRSVDGKDRAGTARLANGFLTLSVGAALLLVAVIVAAGPLVISFLTAGVPDDVARTDTGSAWLLLGLLLLQAPLYLIAYTGVAVQNAHGRFALAAAAPSVENLGIIAVMAAYAVFVGGDAAADPGLGAVALLGGGTTGAVLLHALVQWFAARSCGVSLAPANAWRDPEVRQLVRLAVPSLGYAAFSATRYLAILVVAAAVPGGVVAFTLAIAFYNLPVALGATPAAQAALPTLSRAFARGDDADYSETFNRSFGLASFLTVPAAVGYALLSEPLSSAIAFGEMATPEGRELVRLSLLGISLGVIGEATVVFATKAAYARRDIRWPLLAVALRTVLALGGMLTALAVFEGADMLLALGLVVTVSDLIAAVVLVRGLRRNLPPASRSLPRTVGVHALGSVAMTPAVLLVLWLTSPGDGQLANALVVVAAGVVGGVVYLLSQRALRSPELAALAALRRGDDDDLQADEETGR